MRTTLAMLLYEVVCLASAFAQTSPAVVHNVRAVLPNGREIRPVGGWIPLAPYPFAIALRRDGSEAAIPSIGFPFSLNVIGHPDSPDATARRMPDGAENSPQIETHAGLAYSPDGSLLYVATGDSGKVTIYNTADWKRAGEIALDGETAGQDFKGSFAATLVVSASGRWLYVLDQGNWRVVVIDAEKREKVASIQTGAYPFGLALSPDEKRLYVTNTGLFEYTTIEGVRPDALEATGLHFAPFGYPSNAARNGVIAQGRHISGLGDENSPRGSSLWTYSIEQPTLPAVTAKLRLGEVIAGKYRIGGAAPTGVVTDADAAYVSLAHQDSVVKVSADGTHVLAEAALSPFSGRQFNDRQGKALRGVMPSGMALRDGRLYVAESGIDAVGVVGTQAMRVIEHIPAGWNPSAVTLSPDGSTLYVVNTKGRGTGANGGSAHSAKQPSYIGSLEYGSLGIIQLSTLASAADLTSTVIAANSAAIDHTPPLPRLKHCFLVIRENRTYDEILGDVSGANGEPALARYGLDGWAEEDKSATHLAVNSQLTRDGQAICVQR